MDKFSKIIVSETIERKIDELKEIRTRMRFNGAWRGHIALHTVRIWDLEELLVEFGIER